MYRYIMFIVLILLWKIQQKKCVNAMVMVEYVVLLVIAIGICAKCASYVMNAFSTQNISKYAEIIILKNNGKKDGNSSHYEKKDNTITTKDNKELSTEEQILINNN